MLAALVILLGAGCVPEYEFVVPAQMALFLDPSEANREAVTTKFVEEALPKLRDCGLVTRPGESPGLSGGTCFKRAMSSLLRYADREILRRGLDEQTAFYQTCVGKLGLKVTPGPDGKIDDLEPRLLNLSTACNIYQVDEYELPRGKTAKAVERREEALEQARLTCQDPADEDWVNRCPGRPLLIRAADPFLDKALPRLPPQTQASLAFRNSKPNRLAYLAAALDRPLSGKRSGHDDSLVLDAMKEIFLGEPDPHLWDPEELAVLALSARKYSGGKGLLADQNGGEVFFRLGERIGFQRANQLVPIRSKDFFATARASQLLPDYRHFTTEELFYEREWAAKRIDPATAKLKRWSQTRGGETEAQFLIRRWHENDEAAPHPDIDRVLQIIEKRQQNGGP